ncbi:Cation-chloride cotransporter 1-like protein [Drosera capensis]
MFLISWSFTIVSVALASLIYKYVGIKGKAGDWGDRFKSAYFQLALCSLRSLGEFLHSRMIHVMTHSNPSFSESSAPQELGRGLSIFVSILDGDYHECAKDAKVACHQLSTYIEYKQCEGVAEIIVDPNMSTGFRAIVQTMGLGNLKPNIVVMRYPEIWRSENLTEIPARLVGIIDDCIVTNKAVVIVKGLNEWPNEFQRQFGTIDLYWIVRDGGLMLLLSQLLLTKESFESCKIQVFCIAEEDADAEVEGGSQHDESLEEFTAALCLMEEYPSRMKEAATREGRPTMRADGKDVIVNEQQVEKFLYTTLKLNSTILRYSRMAAVVLVSLPPPPSNHPVYFYMEYMEFTCRECAQASHS